MMISSTPANTLPITLAVSSILLLVSLVAVLTVSQHKQIQELKWQIDEMQKAPHYPSQHHPDRYTPSFIDDTLDDIVEGTSRNLQDLSLSSPLLHHHQQRELTTFGQKLIRDGSTDVSAVIQRKLQKAADNKKGGIVTLPKGIFLITETLVIPPGVTLEGKGYGSSPLAIKFDAGGTVLAYCGDKYAVKIEGHSSVIKNLAVYDWRYPEGTHCDNVKGKGAIRIVADGRLVESVIMKNVFLYWFMGGTALTLEAKNAGGIGFGSFQNVRIRHANKGIEIKADDTSFINSNAFHDGVISGGITEVGLSVNCTGACNENAINDMVIEPPSTELTHVYIKGPKTNIRMNDVRLEGTDLPQEQPIIIIEDDSYQNTINGMVGHTFIKADFNRNPDINVNSAKFVGIDPSPVNLFWNAAFHGLEGTKIPGWQHITSPDNYKLSVLSTDSLYPNHNTIHVNYLNFGGVYKLKPDALPSSPIHSFCTFGIYARTNSSDSIFAAMKYTSGSVISSSRHTGSGNWEFIGMSALYDKNNGPLPYFGIKGDVDIAAPTFTYGSSSAIPGAELMSSSGAQMSGIFTMSMVKFTPPEDSDRWQVPKQGNIFDVQSYVDTGIGPCTPSFKYVTRINDGYTDRFPAGSIITILFPECGGCVPCLTLYHGSYIKLLGGVHYSPGDKVHSSITLVSEGYGVWKEIARNT